MRPPDTLFLSARTLPASPDAVYAAFEQPALLAAWWGPDGFSNHFESFDFRVGGRWVFVMQGPDGTRYPNTSVFEALEPGRRVVLRHDCPPYFTLTVSLQPAPGGTQLTWEQVFDDAATARAVRAIVGPANEQNLDRLTHVLTAHLPHG